MKTQSLTKNKARQRRVLHGAVPALLGVTLLSLGTLPAQAVTLGEISVTDAPYSAKADGQTDNTAAFSSALAAASKTGAIVVVPAGQYAFSGNLTIPAQVVLEGVNAGERTYGGYEGGTGTEPIANAGTVFLVTGGAGSATGTPFITMNANSGLRNVSFYYPNQADPSALPRNSWTPTAYPYTISMTGSSGSIENVSGVNPYQFIEAASSTGKSLRESIRRVNGCPLLMGVFVDYDGDGSGNCGDTVDDIHFVPSFGNGTGTDWVQNHATAIQVNRADEIVLRNCFSFEYSIGLRFGISTAGSASGTIVDGGVDTGNIAVQIDGVQKSAGGLVFEGGGYSAGVSPGYAVDVANTNTGNVTFNGSRFWGSQGRVIYSAGQKGSVTSLFGCYFLDTGIFGSLHHDQLDTNSTIVYCGDPSNPGGPSGKTRIVNCHFSHDQYDYTYTPGEAGVLFEGNCLPHGVRTQGISPTATGPNYIQVNNF